ncbi:uncharacterized protein VP01_535g6 [Puccinia sorghi]|uniref:Uncharacterized protein n=1 Tax=Puccinia sorghi TaxID=27349 RepID=A0A0L6UK14_9BASI|nr:uncharacterized protein VP01_535g6 [Puccinia sorghi]
MKPTTPLHPAPVPALLDSTAGQPNPASNPMVLAKPQPFDRTRCTAAEVFVSQIGLHAVTYPKQFPTDTSKVVFTVSFMKDYTATWTKSSMGNQWSLMTSSTISDPARPKGEHPACRGDEQHHPAPNPNVMDLSAFQKAPSNQLSDAVRARWVQGNLCFPCARHISPGYISPSDLVIKSNEIHCRLGGNMCRSPCCNQPTTKALACSFVDVTTGREIFLSRQH